MLTGHGAVRLVTGGLFRKSGSSSNSPMSLAISGPAIIHRRRVDRLSVKPTAPPSRLNAALFCSWPGRLEWQRTVDSSSVAYREIAGLKFPAYFWMGCGQCDHVSQMSRNQTRVVGVVHRMEPRCQLSRGVQVHLEGSLAQGANVH